MASHFRNQESTSTLPLFRRNKHFRIKSASKQKICTPSEIMSTKLKHKGVDESKRIFSETRHKKSGSIQTSIKVKIAREELEKRFLKRDKDTARKKMLVYQGVRTEDTTEIDENRITSRIKTINLDSNLSNLHKMSRGSQQNQMLNRQNIEQTTKLHFDSNRFKKVKLDRQSKDSKQPKGKYRCRVNQYIFEKKKSLGSKKEEERGTIDEFWKNVNESLILAGRQQEEMSKDLKAFVCDNFITE